MAAPSLIAQAPPRQLHNPGWLDIPDDGLYCVIFHDFDVELPYCNFLENYGGLATREP